MKGVSKTDRFVFDQFPTGIKTADVIGNISGEKSVFSTLDFLFESLAVVGKRRLFAGDNINIRATTKDEHPKDETPYSVLLV